MSEEKHLLQRLDMNRIKKQNRWLANMVVMVVTSFLCQAGVWAENPTVVQLFDDTSARSMLMGNNHRVPAIQSNASRISKRVRKHLQQNGDLAIIQKREGSLLAVSSRTSARANQRVLLKGSD